MNIILHENLISGVIPVSTMDLNSEYIHVFQAIVVPATSFDLFVDGVNVSNGMPGPGDDWSWAGNGADFGPISGIGSCMVVYITEDIMAAENVKINLIKKPLETLALLGSTGLQAGLRKVSSWLDKKACVTDLLWMKQTATVPVGTEYSLTWEFAQKTIITDIRYTNSANSTGYVKNILVDGTPLQLNNGVILTAKDNFLWSELADIIHDCTLAFGKGAKLQIEAVGVNADVVDVILIGRDVNMHLI